MINKVFRNRKGITPVLSSLLLMVITVAAMSIAITATYVITDNLHENMGERFVVEDVWFTSEHISIYLRNVGKVTIKIAAVYINNTSHRFTPLQLEQDQHRGIDITYNWSYSVVYTLKIVTSRGTKVVVHYES